MNIDRADHAARNADAPAAATGKDAARNAERTSGRPADYDDGRVIQRAETRTREEYTDAIRAAGPPSRAESPDARQNPDERQSGRRTGTEGTSDTDNHGKPEPHDREPDGAHAARPKAERDGADRPGPRHALAKNTPTPQP